MLPTGTVLGDFTGKNKTKQKQKKTGEVGQTQEERKDFECKLEEGRRNSGLVFSSPPQPHCSWRLEVPVPMYDAEPCWQQISGCGGFKFCTAVTHTHRCQCFPDHPWCPSPITPFPESPPPPAPQGTTIPHPRPAAPGPSTWLMGVWTTTPPMISVL